MKAFPSRITGSKSEQKGIRNCAIAGSVVFILAIFSNAQAKLVMMDDIRPAPDVASVRTETAVAPPAPIWRADKGSTLRTSLQKWADQAHWTLVWDVPNGAHQQWNYPILASLVFSGSVEQAVAACISLYERADKPLAVQIQRTQKLFHVSLKAAQS